MRPATEPRRAPDGSANLAGGAWLIADMSLNIFALSIVKALGLGYPATQLVFLRAGVGLALMLPWIVVQRRAFRGLTDLPLHGLRVVLSTIALSAGFYAVARLPFALFTAISFTRPLLMMALAAVILREAIPRRSWLAALAGLAGVVIAVGPTGLSGGRGLAAMACAVFAGTAAIIVTRRLVAAPTVVMMSFYTAGLTLIAGAFALVSWQPIAPEHRLPLLAVGCFAQTAQFFFLRAHALAEAGFLAPLSYASLILSTTAGYVFFDEWPRLPFWFGAALIVAATLWITLQQRKQPRPRPGAASGRGLVHRN